MSGSSSDTNPIRPSKSLLWPCVGLSGVGWGISEVETFRAEPTVRFQTEWGQTVIPTGPYAIVRHPLYMWSLFLFPGFALALGSYWAMAPKAIACIVLVA